MPTLCGLAAKGVRFAAHRAVFPTETRVNSASLATGSYPQIHGIVANKFLDRPSDLWINTGDAASLARLEATAGRCVLAPTLAERVRAAGMSCGVVGSGSPGSTLLQDPCDQDLLANVRGFVRPQSREGALRRDYGAVPPAATPAQQWNDQACEIFAREVVRGGYDLGIAWLCDPDFTQHKCGLGAPESMDAIAQQDARLAMLIGELPPATTVLVASDHGFSTVAAPLGPNAIAKQLGVPDDRLQLASSGIYLADPKGDLETVVDRLLRQPWIGPVFVHGSAGSQYGDIAGTFSLGAVGIDYPTRSPDIVFSRRWNQDSNEHGVPGFVFGAAGLATHGSMSPFDRRCVLVAAGPAIKKGMVSDLPSAAVDIAPTLLSLLGVAAPSLDGRVLVEALATGPDADALQVDLETHRIDTFNGRTQAMVTARVAGSSYLNDFEL
jgi:predicted AlkP superfamily pyrophosphatase or phosphodiesterase